MLLERQTVRSVKTATPSRKGRRSVYRDERNESSDLVLVSITLVMGVVVPVTGMMLLKAAGKQKRCGCKDKGEE